MRTVPAAGRAPRRHWPSAAGFRGPRFDGAQRALSLAEGRKTVAAHTLAALNDAASRDALRRQMSGGTIAGVDLRSTRITETGLAARNRRADFPAPQASLTAQHVARSRRPRPSSTGTTREGSAERVSATFGSLDRAGAERAGGAGRGAPPGAHATPVTSALCRAPGGAVPRQDPLAERRRLRTQALVGLDYLLIRPPRSSRPSSCTPRLTSVRRRSVRRFAGLSRPSVVGTSTAVRGDGSCRAESPRRARRPDRSSPSAPGT